MILPGKLRLEDESDSKQDHQLVCCRNRHFKDRELQLPGQLQRLQLHYLHPQKPVPPLPALAGRPLTSKKIWQRGTKGPKML